MKGIHDLAQHLGLTVGTVSRALNDRPEVSEETRKRVRAAATEIGYVPNQSGRSLRTGTTNTVGFMIESGSANALAGDNFFMGVVGGVQQVLDRHGLDLVLLPCGPVEDPHAYLRRMVSRRFVDGMILSATQRHDARIEFLARTGVPFVALGRSATPVEHAWIDLDFAGVAADAVGRLAARGHRRIAVAIPDGEANLGYVFLDGYREGMARHALGFDPDLVVRVEPSEAGGVTLADRLLGLEPRPTAVVLVNELLAIGLYHRLSEVGLRAGHDLAVVGFRDNPQARFLSPALSCYRLSLTALGLALGETLLAMMPATRDAYAARDATRVWPLTYAPGASDTREIRSSD